MATAIKRIAAEFAAMPAKHIAAAAAKAAGETVLMLSLLKLAGMAITDEKKEEA